MPFRLLQFRRFGIAAHATAVMCFLGSESYTRAGMTETRFTVVDSSSSSWVARGYSDYTVSPENGWTFNTSRNFDQGVNLDLQGPALPGTVVTDWFMDFAAPFSVPITPGFYPNFQRWPFQDFDRPGLAFGSSGRLDNMASGHFEVFEATYAPNGDVLSFSADFTHFGETIPANYAIVEVRYNATVPEPSMLTLALGVSTLMVRRRHR